MDNNSKNEIYADDRIPNIPDRVMVDVTWYIEMAIQKLRPYRANFCFTIEHDLFINSNDDLAWNSHSIFNNVKKHHLCSDRMHICQALCDLNKSQTILSYLEPYYGAIGAGLSKVDNDRFMGDAEYQRQMGISQ